MSMRMTENDPEYILMGYVIRDEDTDEIVGICDDAPDEIKTFYDAYINNVDNEPSVF